MILRVVKRQVPLDHLLSAALALIGAGVLKLFDDGEPVRLPPVPDSGQVTCDTAQGGYAKAGLYAAGFDVPTATEPAPDPGTIQPVVTLTVIPAFPDDLDPKHYPDIGAFEWGMTAAKALCGAYVTRPIGANDDPYTGDPGTSMQVCCNKADLTRAIIGFKVARFTATVKS